MNIVEMYAKVREIYEANKDDYDFIGLRFEDKEREIDDECEWSKDNPDRDDERDFPEYGSEEYGELPTLDGTSTWDMSPSMYRYRDYHPGMGEYSYHTSKKDVSYTRYFLTAHCYVVAGNDRGRHDYPDDGEILIRDAKVIAKIF